MSAPRYADTPTGLPYCQDCGVVVADEGAHTRFHDILGDHAIAIALTMTAHASERRHNKYDLYDRVRSKQKGNNWSAEAFADVTGLQGDLDRACNDDGPGGLCTWCGELHTLTIERADR